MANEKGTGEEYGGEPSTHDIRMERNLSGWTNALARPFKSSEDVTAIFKALIKAQPSLAIVEAAHENEFFHSKYANLANYLDAMREPLSEQKLGIFQTTRDTEAGYVTLITTLIHESGQWLSGEMTLKPDKMNSQGIGSTMTYARRYGAAAIVGMAQQDDDAQGGTNAPGEYEALTAEHLDKVLVYADELFGGDAEKYLKSLCENICGVEAVAKIAEEHYEMAMRALKGQAQQDGYLKD